MRESIFYYKICNFELFHVFSAWNNELSRMESQTLNRNAIVLDWGKLSRCPYRHATEYYVPEIGYHLHRMLSNVLQLNLRSVNCVGHSLGAHVVCDSTDLFHVCC